MTKTVQITNPDGSITPVIIRTDEPKDREGALDKISKIINK